MSQRAEIYAALAVRAGFEVLHEDENEKQLRVFGRCPVQRWPQFAPIVQALLLATEKPGAPWTCDVSKKYVLKDGQVCYGWRLIFQGNGLANQYANIVAAISGAPKPARVEITSILLPGYKPGQVRGGVDAKGKGVSSADTPPAIFSRRRT